MIAGSLFAGIGGFELALQRHGIPTVWSSEICRFANGLVGNAVAVPVASWIVERIVRQEAGG